jgi:hypothetical protein
MKIASITARGWSVVAVLVLSAGFCASAQDTSGEAPSLGDAARKARQEHAAAGHVAAKQTFNGEDEGPDAGGVWRVRLCTLTPCYELSVTLPKTPKWSRATEGPRPVLIPVSGHEEDPSRAIRVYAAESNDLKYTVDSFKRAFLQGWFARPEYFGQAARLERDEHVKVDWSTGTITHFTVTTPTLKYRGLSVVAGSPYGNYGFACVFRDEDSAVAAGICDAIMKSAQYQELQPSYIRRVYPPADDPDEPADDPPDNDPQ